MNLQTNEGYAGFLANEPSPISTMTVRPLRTRPMHVTCVYIMYSRYVCVFVYACVYTYMVCVCACVVCACMCGTRHFDHSHCAHICTCISSCDRFRRSAQRSLWRSSTTSAAMPRVCVCVCVCTLCVSYACACVYKLCVWDAGSSHVFVCVCTYWVYVYIWTYAHIGYMCTYGHWGICVHMDMGMQPVCLVGDCIWICMWVGGCHTHIRQLVRSDVLSVCVYVCVCGGGGAYARSTTCAYRTHPCTHTYILSLSFSLSLSLSHHSQSRHTNHTHPRTRTHTRIHTHIHTMHTNAHTV